MWPNACRTASRPTRTTNATSPPSATAPATCCEPRRDPRGAGGRRGGDPPRDDRGLCGHPHSDGSEPAIVEALRADGDLALSLIAERPDGIVGHAAFSRVTLSNGEEGWFALGPISVEPGQQRQGIGRALVEAGCERLRERGAGGIVVVGEPAYYSRFGFARGTPLRVDGPMGDYFQVLAFAEHTPDAKVAFAPAFGLD